MSSASDLDVDEDVRSNSSAEKVPEIDGDEACEDGDGASEEHVVPVCFDTSKLKEGLRTDKMVEPLEAELDFEEEIHEKEDVVVPSTPKDAEGDEDVVKKQESQDEHEEGEADEGEVTDEDDLEEGEVKDGSSNRKLQPRPICRFFNKGQCTWGTSCRFIHPGVNDKGNYNMFAPPKPTFGPNSNLLLPVPPPPMMMMMMGGPGHNFLPRMGMRGPDVAFPPAAVEEAAPVESAWERGLRHAKEILKKASRRKEQEPDFEEKRMNLSIDSNDKGPDYDKENDYYGSRSPHRRSDSHNYSGKYEESAEIFENSDRESREVWRSGRYENFEVRWPRQDFDNRDRSNKDKPRYQRSYDREKYDRHGSQDEERWREDRHSDNPTRGDEWRDPWRRSKTPKGRSRSRGRSRRSYSSETSRSFSSRSSRSSYSYSRSSSSKSSYFSSDSYSRSRSRSPFSRLGSRSPPSRPRNYDRNRQDSGRRRHHAFNRSPGRSARSPARTARSPPRRSTRSPPLRAPRSPPLRVARSPPSRAARSPPLRAARSPQPRLARSPPVRPARSPPSRNVRSPPQRAARSPVRMPRRKASPGKDTTKQIPLPPPIVPMTITQSVSSTNETSADNPSDSRPAVQKAVSKRGRLPRSYSGSDSSHSLSRSASRSSSSASRSRSRSVSRSGSYSRSISMSSVSSASGSDSSSESDAKRRLRSPGKEVTTKPEAVRKYEEKGEGKVATKTATGELPVEREPERIKEKLVLPKPVDVVVAPKEKKISMLLPKQLHVTPIQTMPIIPKQSKDLLRQSGQKPQIKLTLLNKAAPAPSLPKKISSASHVMEKVPKIFLEGENLCDVGCCHCKKKKIFSASLCRHEFILLLTQKRRIKRYANEFAFNAFFLHFS